MSFSVLTQDSNLYTVSDFLKYTYDYQNIFFSIAHCWDNWILQVSLSAYLPLTLKISMLCFKLHIIYSANKVLQNIYKYLFIL